MKFLKMIFLSAISMSLMILFAYFAGDGKSYLEIACIVSSCVFLLGIFMLPLGVLMGVFDD